MAENSKANRGRSREYEDDSRSATDNDGSSGDDQVVKGRPARRKRYHRHTAHQIQELESIFMVCPHPDEKRRLELSKKLKLDTRQVKFWFQNRRTQKKTQHERNVNTMLKEENVRLRSEIVALRKLIHNPLCQNCAGPIMTRISLEDERLTIEKSKMMEGPERARTGTFLGPSTSQLGHPVVPQAMPNSILELDDGGHGFEDLDNDFGLAGALRTVPPARTDTVYFELALAAMDELMKMAQTDEPLWLRNLEVGGREVLNYEEYLRIFGGGCIGPKPNGFGYEASRESGMSMISSLNLVDTLMDSRKWLEMFPSMITRSLTTDVISDGLGGTQNCAVQLMHAELRVLSPLVPARELNFLRFCKQFVEGIWAVVDVSIDSIEEPLGAQFLRCRKKPSGILVHDMPNGYSKVTWVEHTEYDEGLVHQLYRPLIAAGMGFGAQRWIATLQRQCECQAIFTSSSPLTRNHPVTTLMGWQNMLKLSNRMTNDFYGGISGSTAQKWEKFNVNNVDADVRVMTRRSVDDPGTPPGIVLCASTSIWLAVSPKSLFEFLRDEGRRSEWDILSNGEPMHRISSVAKGRDQENSICLLRCTAMEADQVLILMETSTDATGSLVVYAPVDADAIQLVMNGGDPALVSFLPSGFAIFPDGPNSCDPPSIGSSSSGGLSQRFSGSLLTVAFQILVNNAPTAKLMADSVETVNSLLTCTIKKIRDALHCEH